jgi:predicted transposase YdaD
MYNIIGRCGFGSKCKNYHDDLPVDVKEKMDKWIKACKEEAKKDGKKKGKAAEKKEGDE